MEQLVPVLSMAGVGLVAGVGLTAGLAHRARGLLASENRGRIAALVAGVPLMLCAVPLLVHAGRRAVWDMVGAEHAPVLLGGVVFLVVWPVVLGVLSLARGLVRRPPSLLAFATAAVMHMLAALGAALNLAAEIVRGRASHGDLFPMLVVLALLLLPLYPLGQGFARAGWTRWAHLLMGVWLIYAAEAVVLQAAIWGSIDQPEVGRLVMALALPMALSALAWALPSRRVAARA